MKHSQLCKLVLATLIVSLFGGLSRAAAQSAAPFANQITFDSFTGIYHLSRDSRGLSLLTTEETIVADFPASGFYGITRALPKTFQNHNVNVKILNISDAAGNTVPYKTSTDKSNNLVITTGDPAITLTGSQTIKINYQTTGVINLAGKSDTLLLNVNGRGWDQPFSRVNATLYVPASFNAQLQRPAGCYTALNDTNGTECRITTRRTSDSTVITANARFVAPHQALVMRLDFKPDTFTNKHNSPKPVIVLLTGSALLALAFSLIYARKVRRQKRTI